MLKAKTKIGFADIAICILSLAAAVILLIFALSSSSLTANVSVTSENFESSYSLNDDRTVQISSCGYTLTLEIKDGAARIAKCDCPDKVCVSTGWIKDRSRIIVCAPAKTVIRIENGGGGTDVDFVAGR